MHACNSLWSSGTSTIHPYSPFTVRKSSRHVDGPDSDSSAPAANHRFNAEESDWGFTRFAEIRKLFASQWEDRGRPMVEDDAVNVTAYVRVYKDPTGVLWHNFVK